MGTKRKEEWVEESRKEHLFGFPVQPCQSPQWWPSPTSPTSGGHAWSHPTARALLGSNTLGSSLPEALTPLILQTLPCAPSSWKLGPFLEVGLSPPGLFPHTSLVLFCRCWIPLRFQPPVSGFFTPWETGTFLRAEGVEYRAGRGAGALDC